MKSIKSNSSLYFYTCINLQSIEMNTVFTGNNSTNFLDQIIKRMDETLGSSVVLETENESKEMSKKKTNLIVKSWYWSLHGVNLIVSVVSHNQVNPIQVYLPMLENILNVIRSIEASVATFHFLAMRDIVNKTFIQPTRRQRTIRCIGFWISSYVCNRRKYVDFFRILAISDLKPYLVSTWKYTSCLWSNILALNEPRFQWTFDQLLLKTAGCP